ncbi:DUF7526 family protein [Halobaculum sp. EA56]|uniref:DUF7526 family protein n=1 Tax=Halobaculum sp. EA56 TaxID=3421648 RepID=UPI003EB89D9A
MSETIRVSVVHAVPPEEHGEQELRPRLRELAAGKHVLVCRVGGRPSWLDRLRAFLARDPIEAVTVVASGPASEGDELTMAVEETDISGVYVAVEAD